MNRWLFSFAILVGNLAGLSTSARAEQVSVTVPADTKFLVKLDFTALKKSAIGVKLFEIVKKKAGEEFTAKVADEPAPGWTKIHEMLGFDPLEEFRSILVSGSSFDHPEKSVVVSIQLGKTSGNLEGMVLALPGYAAEEYGPDTIHSATPEEDTKVFGVIHTDANGLKTILMATQRDTLIHQLDFLNGKSTTEAKLDTVKLAIENDAFISLRVLDVPAELLGDGPQSGVAKIVRGVSFHVAESEGLVNCILSLTAATEKQAEQLKQMAQGLIALVGFAESNDPDDTDLKQVAKLVNGIKTSVKGTSATFTLSVPIDDVSKLIEEID